MPKVQRNCKACGREFSFYDMPSNAIYGSGRGSFCSRSCATSWHAKNGALQGHGFARPGYKHSEETKRKISEASSRTQKGKKRPWQKKPEGLTMLGRAHSEETKKKMSEALKEAWKRNTERRPTIPVASSEAEDRILHVMLRLGFEHQFRVNAKDVNRKYYVLDFAHPAKKINVEIDGFHHRFDDSKMVDEARDADLEAQGWTVLRFWARETKSKREFVRGLLSLVS